MVGVGLLFVAGGVGAYYEFDHVRQRIDKFLDPAGSEAYQVARSLEAFRNGGIYGVGPGEGQVKAVLPDAHAEGPTPISAVLSGLLLNVALYAVVRAKVLVDGALANDLAGRLLMGFGLLSVVVAAFLLSRQRDVKRLFAYSSIEHMGLMTFAFGMAGPIANFAGLLHMTVHSLVKSAIFTSE